MAALADVAPYGAGSIGPAFFPRLRRGLHDFARLAGFSSGASLKLTLTGGTPIHRGRLPAPRTLFVTLLRDPQ